VVGEDAVELLTKAESIVRENPFLEFRLDYLRQPGAALPKLKRFLELHPEATVVATCRRAPNGGKFRGSLASELDVLLKAAATGFHLVDIELESASALRPNDYEKLRTRVAIILSHHDFRATRKLDETFEAMRGLPADFYKLVSTATSLRDNVTMMKFLEKTSYTHSVVGICMGEQGIISRLLGLRAGSVFTFAAAFPGEETGPGQIAARSLRDVYRVESIDAATRLYGVAGDPVAHSLSPLMMNTAFRRENVNAVYLPLHAKKLEDLLACIRDIPINGVSVTMPYKSDIVEHLDNTDALTGKIGACNTVIRAQDGKLYGFNTDVAGIVEPLSRRMALAGAKILVLGAGGAARAAVFGLKERGCQVYILNRTPQRGQKLAREARVHFVKRADLKKHSFDVVINATSVGMGNGNQSPVAEKEIRARFAFDMVYRPMETQFLKNARGEGAETIPGFEMFIHQGARQFEIWTGKPAPIDEMRNVVQLALSTPPAGTNGKRRGDT
jgi:3-dehydroquinate dehydratase/shikimate dehydrogenase